MAATRKITLTGIVLFTGMAMLLALPVSSWAQGPPVIGTGTGTITELEVLDSREVGNNRIETRRLTVALVGALEGTFVQEVRGVVSANDQVRFQGTGRFDGTLEGCGDDGTSHFRLTGRGQAGVEPGLPATTVKATVVDQASTTVPATGHGTFTQTGPTLTYEVEYVCHE